MKKLLLGAGLAAVTITLSAAANAQMTDQAREQQLEAYRTYSASQGSATAGTSVVTSDSSPETVTTPAVANTSTPVTSAPVATAPDATAIVTTTTPIEPTTTVEKTTSTNYTVRKRKVGLIGGRSYQPRTEEIEGGVVKEVTVNGVETEKEVVKPDPMEGKTVEAGGGDYYSGPRGVQEYKEEEAKANSNLDVHYTGRYNR